MPEPATIDRVDVELEIAKTLRAALALHQGGKAAEAERRYREILEQRPSHFDARRLLGLARAHQGDDADALRQLRIALDLRPDSDALWSNLGMVSWKLGRLEDAILHYDKALQLNPANVEALNNRGLAKRDLKRPIEALQDYEQALSLDARSFDAHCNRGVALMDLGQAEAALEVFDRAIAIRPNSAEAFCNRGNALIALARTREALESCDKALALRPRYFDALYNSGNILRDLGRLEDAVARYQAALSLRPDFVEGLNNCANVLVSLRRTDEALAAYDKALAIKPNMAETLHNRGLALLLLGDFTSGFAGYERRWDRYNSAKRKWTLPQPLWLGGEIAGKRILIFEEQGLGDTIQFSRYLPLLASKGAQVTFLVDRRMHRLLRRLEPRIRLADSVPTDQTFDFQCPLLSLPFAMGTVLQTINADVPYLTAEPGKIEEWRQRIGAHGLRIGIAWQGKPGGGVDIGRSIPLHCFAPICASPGVRLISLQKTHGLDQLEGLPRGMRVETLGEDFDSGSDAFVDTAGVMANLDLIVTSDTSIAHLAGAMSRPVWVAIKHVPDWRWMLDRADSPWYPTMRLYRQLSSSQWRHPFEQIASDISTGRLSHARHDNLLAATATTQPPRRLNATND